MSENTCQPYGLVEEAERIVGKLPCWKTVYFKGKQETGLWRIDVEFNEKNKIRYYKNR